MGQPLAEHALPTRIWISVLLHAILVAAGYWLAFLLRFEFPLSAKDWRSFVETLPLIVVLRVTAFAWLHLYEELWRYVSMRDIVAILKAVTVSSVVFAAAVLGIVGRDFPWPIVPIDWGVCLLLVGGIRLALRAWREYRMRGRATGKRRALIIGAGDAGELLIREIGRNSSLGYRVVGFVDDDSSKQRKRIHGVRVVGMIDQLPTLCRSHDVQELLIAIPSASGAELRRIISACRSARVEYKTVPRLAELLDNSLSLSKVRRVSINDLLRREPVRIDQAGVEKFLKGKRVLVTGAGGSIGSELCRQIARFKPATLALVDRAENNLFFLELEFRDRLPQLPVLPIIGDVTDGDRMDFVFQQVKPHVVFHAAAHKHVPLMEQNKPEAVKNNLLGTITVAKAAERHEVEDFVLLSTDKAVRPTSVMGATKRLAEMFVQALNAKSRTRFMTVRFGNVLASEGSVLQVFQRQIEAGGPITVTHPDMTRYFMTIPEASQLVLQAATQGEGGEIFVLDMGDPVRIVDLANDLITLSGLDPGKDIEIRFTGPRPGEKIFEELFNPEAKVLPTPHEKIMVVESDPGDLEALHQELASLIEYAQLGDEKSLLAKLAGLVPEYVNGHTPALMPREKLARILLVERDVYTRMTLRRILQPRYVIFEAESEREALQQARALHPNLAILGFHFPGVNTKELCAKLKHAKDEGKLPLIILADSSETTSLNQVLAMGADDWIYKPIPVSILENRVARLIEREGPRPE